MALSRRIAFTVFAACLSLFLIALAGCGDDGSPSEPADPGAGPEVEATGELSAVCRKEGTKEQAYGAQGPGPTPGTVRVAYASGGSIFPCSARLDGDVLVLSVLDPKYSTLDLRVHCAEVDIGAAGIEDVESGVSETNDFGVGSGSLEAALGENDCERIPILG